MECQPIRAWAGLCSFSPSGYLLAAVIGRKITIQETGSDSEGTLVFLCADNVEYIEWSADSQLILSCCASQAQLEVWSVHRPEWKCRVQAGAFGIHSACFAPSSRHVLITSKLFLRISIWSLLERSVRHIDLPKDGRPGLDFRPGGSHVAVAERRDARDCVAIYSCHSWTRVALIDTETVDLGGVRWSPDGGKVAVWDSVHAGRWSVYSMAGALLGRQESAGDIHDVQWNPSAQLLAVAQSGSKVQLIAHLTWRPIATLEMHWSTVEEQSCVVYAESDNRLKCG